MGVLWGDGFEDEAQAERGIKTGTWVGETQYGTNGRKGVSLGDVGGKAYQSPIFDVDFTDESSIWWTFKFKISDHLTNIATFAVAAAGTTMAFQAQGTQAGGQWQMTNYNGNSDSALFGSFSVETWYEVFIEKRYGSGGFLKVWINGSLDLHISGQNFTAVGTADMKLAGTGSSDVDQAQYMDAAMGDGSGSPSSGFPLSIEVHTLLPDGNGNTSGLTGSDGNSVDNYALVDEDPPSTADYVGSATEGDKDTYTMGNLASTTEAVHGIIVENLTIKTDAGAKYARAVVRTSSTDYAGASKALSESWDMQFETWDKNPNTTNDWTGTEVNGIEVGPEVRDS